MGKIHLYILMIFVAWVSSSQAKEGDTTIHIFYETKSVRVNPKPLTGGDSVDFRIILHADGSIDDSYSTRSGPHGAYKSKLGKRPPNLTYKVLNSSTIVRTNKAKNYTFTMTISVAGKNCSATVTRILNPGEKYFREYSGDLKAMSDFSSIENTYTACVIE